MGTEYKGIVEKRYSPSTAKSILMQHFVALQWTIVRNEKQCFSIAMPVRPNQSWDEDFVICLEDGIYLLDHRSQSSVSLEVKNIINDVLHEITGTIYWEDL